MDQNKYTRKETRKKAYAIGRPNGSLCIQKQPEALLKYHFSFCKMDTITE